MLTKQIQRCYSLNRRTERPVQLHLTSFGGRTKTRLEEAISGFRKWDVSAQCFTLCVREECGRRERGEWRAGTERKGEGGMEEGEGERRWEDERGLVLGSLMFLSVLVHTCCVV